MAFFPPVPSDAQDLADMLVEIQQGSIEDALALLDPHMVPDMEVREILLDRLARETDYPHADNPAMVDSFGREHDEV